jgi:hypothetical protein
MRLLCFQEPTRYAGVLEQYANEKNEVHVVFGTSGEYSDRTEWPIAAYLVEAEAKKHVEAATRVAQTIHAEFERSFTVKPWNEQSWEEEQAWVKAHKNPYDPQMELDVYTGTTYYYVSVPCAVRCEPSND